MANDALSKIRQIHQDIRAFFEERDLAYADAKPRSVLRRFSHFWLLVGKSFVRNRCPVRASALAYSTLLALVPMLAVALSVTTGVLKQKGEDPIAEFVQKLVEHITPYTGAATAEAAAQAEAARQHAVKEINGYIHRINTGAIGTTGMVALLFVAIMMLARIEGAFNDIWGVTRGRRWPVRMVLYWTALTLGPLLLVVALGLTSGPYLQFSKTLLTAAPWVAGLLFRFAPVLVLSVLFSLFYLAMPNTKVRWGAALVGGLMAGLLWHLNNAMSVYFVSRITSNNAIYSSLGMLPVLMIGLYFAWLILLFGAQVSYAFQNRESYVESKQIEGLSQRGRELAALRIMEHLARSFHEGEKAPSVNAIAAAIGAPSRLIAQIMQSLLQAGIVVEVMERENGFTPARPLEQITVHDVLMALRVGQGHEPSLASEREGAQVHAQFERVSDAERLAASAVSLKDLITAPVETG